MSKYLKAILVLIFYPIWIIPAIVLTIYKDADELITPWFNDDKD